MSSHEKQKSTHIDRRDDVNPSEGEHKYGDVQFADPTNNRAVPPGMRQPKIVV